MNIILNRFETNNCVIYVIDTEFENFGEKIYCLVSVHNKDLHQNIRFGNKVQINSMIKSYRINNNFRL